jgi:N-acetylmuramoyl-L-alanine amidase
VTNANGTETYVMGLKRTSEKEKAIQGSMEAADSSDVETTENAYIVNEKNYKQNYHGFDPSKPETYILLALRSSAYLNQSITFADNIEHQFLKAGRPSREVRQKSLAVLAGTAMPAVLVETGFINNPDDESYLNSAKGQEETAACIARAIEQYKDDMRRYRSLRTPGDSMKSDPASNHKTADKPPVVYRIQLLVSDKQYAPSDPLFKNIGDKVLVEPTKLNNDKVYKYMTGKYNSPDAAGSALETIRQIGFKDAFVVGYQGGERIAD